MIKQKIVSILSIITFICLVLISFSLSIRDVCIDTLTDRVIESKILHEVSSDIKAFVELDYKDSARIKRVIVNNPNVRNMTKQYFDNFIGTVLTEETFVVPNVNKELNNLINNCEEIFSNLELTDEQKDLIRSSIRKNRIINEFYLDFSSQIQQNLTDTQRNLIELYHFLNSVAFRIIFGIIILVGIILITVLSKSVLGTIKEFGIIFILAGVFSLGVVPLFLNSMGTKVYQTIKILSSNITLRALSVVSEIYIIIGIILILIYGIIYAVGKYKSKKIEESVQSLENKQEDIQEDVENKEEKEASEKLKEKEDKEDEEKIEKSKDKELKDKEEKPKTKTKKNKKEHN